MGYMIAMGYCVACKGIVHFNPNLVPSIRVNGKREPLCRSCAERWNELHPEQARPISDKAYDVADESSWEDN